MSVAAKIKEFLDAAWTTCPDKDMNPRPRYAAAVATKFVEFVDQAEQVLKNFAGRISALEAQVQSLGGQPQAATPPSDESAAPPSAAPPPPAVAGATSGAPGPDMVRVDAMGQPMTPQEQAAEEETDIKFDGKIDMTRYKPRSDFSGGGKQPPQARG